MALLWLSVIAGVALAEEGSGPSLEARAGFAGLYKSGVTLPVRVTVENRGEDLNGRLTVSVARVRLARTISLPSPSRKVYYLELPSAPGGGRVVIELVWPEGSLRREVALEPLGRASRLLVHASGSAAALRRPAHRRQGQLRLALLGAAELPRGHAGYQALDGLSLDSSAAASLAPAQQRALSDWLLVGGRLTVFAERPERIRPVLLEWPMWPIGFGGGEVSGPWDFSWGLGAVRLSPPRRPIGPEVVAAALPGFASTSMRSSPGAPARPRPQGVLEPRPGRGLGAFAVLYLGAVTLVAVALPRYGAVARRRSLILVGLAVLFSLTGSGIRALVDGGRLLLAETVVVHVFAQADDAWVVGHTEYLAPGPGEIELSSALRAPQLVAVSTDRLEEYRREGLGPAVVALRGAPWARGRLDWQGFTDPGFRLAAGPGGDLRVLNRSGEALRECRYQASDGGQAAADVPPGGELLLSSDMAAGGAAQLLVCSLDHSPAALESRGPAKRLAQEASVVFHLRAIPGPVEAAG